MTDLRPLKGARIWLSGSISPEIDGRAADSFNAFVAGVSALIFSAGGSIIHGSHPSIVPTLLKSAENYQAARGSRDCLVLAASKFYHERYAAQLAHWQSKSIVHEEPTVEDDEEKSMVRLRHWIADRCDAMIGVGGKWWKENPGAAGIPQEFELARD